jgi:hypothetical protein
MNIAAHKISVVIWILLSPLAVYGQRQAKVVYLKNSPLVKGYTLV